MQYLAGESLATTARCVQAMEKFACDNNFLFRSSTQSFTLTKHRLLSLRFQQHQNSRTLNIVCSAGGFDARIPNHKAATPDTIRVCVEVYCLCVTRRRPCKASSWLCLHRVCVTESSAPEPTYTRARRRNLRLINSL